jgi:hypothetical protein
MDTKAPIAARAESPGGGKWILLVALGVGAVGAGIAAAARSSSPPSIPNGSYSAP